MKKSLLSAILIFSFFLFFQNVLATPFPNGSFETGPNGASLFIPSAVTSWSFPTAPTQTNACNQLGGSPNGNFTQAQLSTSSHSDGFYSALITAGGGAGVECGVMGNLDKNVFSGKVNFSVDWNKPVLGGGINLSILFDGNLNKGGGGTECGVASATEGTGTLTCQTPANIIGSDYNVSWMVYNNVGGVRSIYLDNFRYQVIPTMLMNVEEEADPFPIDVNFSLTNELFLDTNGTEVTDAICTVNWNGSNFSMPYNSTIGKYELTRIQSIPQVVYYGVGCSKSGYDSDQNVNGSVTFTLDLSGAGVLTVTDIQNVSHSIQTNQVNFNPGTELNDIIYSIQNNYGSALTIPQHIFNSLVDNRQYFVYTATSAQYDAGTWVFDDTLTFGLSQEDPIQKIFSHTLGKYDYSFNDTILNGEIKYYKLVYKNPYKNFQSISNSSEWYSVLEPTVFDGNSIDVDVYQTSSFSNIRNVYIPNIPNIFGDENQAFEFQFTAWADSNNVTLNAGQTIFGSDATSSVTLSTSPRRYSFTINETNYESQVLMKSFSTSPHTIYIYDYSIVPRGYFTKRLELSKLNGDFLDLFLVDGISKQYIKEGKAFIAKSEAYDTFGSLTELRIEGFMDNSGADINKISKSIQDLNSSAENLIEINEEVQGIVDLNGTAQNPLKPRDFILRATLLDNAGKAISTQSKVVKFVQYPYFPEDIGMTFFPTEKKKGKNPAGILQANLATPDALIAYDVRIWDTNSGTSITNPLYQDVIYKGSDFSCTGSNCGFQFKVNDFIFQNSGHTFIAITAMLNTENFTLTNPLVQTIRSFYVSTIDFDVGKIHQLNERVDRTYSSTEEIPLILVLRDTEATDISEKIDVYVTIANCSDSTPSNGPCVQQSTKFESTGFQYDSKSNLNYYFFRHLWYLDNGSLLPDGNYIAFRAHVSDKTGISTTVTPVLADKCAVNGTDWWSNAISSIINGFGCLTPQADTVFLGDSQERALLIDDSNTTTAPSQELFACVNPDTNNVIDKPLEANLYCFVWYQTGEKPIDDFRLRITNQYSKLSDTGATKQYVEFQIPYELISINDLPLLKQELETNQQTSITTVGDFIQAGFAEIAKGGLKNLGGEALINGSNLLGNIGADANFQQLFSPASVGGFAWFQIKGLPVINAQDFKNNIQLGDDFETIDKTEFLNYLAENQINFQPKKKAEMNLIVNSFTIPEVIKDQNGYLLINEEPTNQKINAQNSDANQPYQYIPATLFFTVQNTMFYDNHSGNDTRSLIIKIITPITTGILTGIQTFIQDLIEDPIETLISFSFQNILIIWIIIMVAIIYVYLQRKSGNYTRG